MINIKAKLTAIYNHPSLSILRVVSENTRQNKVYLTIIVFENNISQTKGLVEGNDYVFNCDLCFNQKVTIKEYTKKDGTKGQEHPMQLALNYVSNDCWDVEPQEETKPGIQEATIEDFFASNK